MRASGRTRTARRDTRPYDRIVENPSLTRGGKNVKFSIVASKDCQCEEEEKDASPPTNLRGLHSPTAFNTVRGFGRDRTWPARPTQF